MASLLGFVTSCGEQTTAASDDLQPGPDAGDDSPPPDESPGPGEYARSIDFAGLTRAYDVLVPEVYADSVEMPLVVDLHAVSNTKEIQASLSGFGRVAREQGFIAVWPQGIHNSWNAYDCCGEAEAQDVDDVGFIVAVVEEVAATWNVDRKRIYVTGYGNGGSMAHRLACEKADLFAAAAPVAFGYDVAQQDCAPFRPLSVILFCGADDTEACGHGTAGDSFETWAGLNSCTGAPVDAAADCQTYTDCEQGVTTTLCSPEATHFDIYQQTDIAGATWGVFTVSPMPRFAVTSFNGG